MAQRLTQISSSISNNSRLHQIRKRTPFDTEELKDVLYYPGCYNRYISPYFDFMSSKNIFSHNITLNLLALSSNARKRLKCYTVDLENDPMKLFYMQYAINSFDLAINTKTSVHYTLYTNSFVLFGSNQKHKEFYKRATSFQDIGCFGLTEFHHGSYSKGIQTKAIYDHKKRSFILTTEGSKGMKFWIGGAAQVVNMSIIWAQLIIDGKSQGPHPFVVPLRCKKTHRVLQRITIGDCGPKNGANGIDNGFIMLDDVSIPVDNLLGRFGYINQSGSYISPVADLDRRFGLFMTGLSSGRGLISFRANVQAVNALTIALRYACGRKQFQSYANKQDEAIIIDYPITKVRLIPYIATTLLQLMGGVDLARLYFGKDKEFLTNQAYGAQLHAISSAVKSRYTTNIARIVSESRTVLGGHGYSALSGFDKLFHCADVNQTWEGDNNVLLQQTSKYLMKIIASRSKTRLVNLDFVHDKPKIQLEKIGQDLRSIANVQLMLQDLFRTKYHSAKAKIVELKKTFKDSEVQDLCFHPQGGNTLVLTFADYYTFTLTKSKITTVKNKNVQKYLEGCLLLWAFDLFQKQKYGTHDLRKSLQKEIVTLSHELVDGSVLAIDAIAPSSFIIGSPFADFNGEGFKEYVNTLYTKKDTFIRSPYFQNIIKARRV